MRNKIPIQQSQTQKSGHRPLKTLNQIPRAKIRTHNNSQGNNSLLEFSYPTSVGHGYCNIVEVQEKDIKTNCMKIIDIYVFEEEIISKPF